MEIWSKKVIKAYECIGSPLSPEAPLNKKEVAKM